MRYTFLFLTLGVMLTFGCTAAERKQKFEVLINQYAAQYNVSFTIELVNVKGINWDRCLDVPITESFARLTTADSFDQLLSELESLKFFTRIQISPHGKVIHLIKDEIGLDDAANPLNTFYEHFHFDGFPNGIRRELNKKTPSISIYLQTFIGSRWGSYAPKIPIQLSFERVTIRDILTYCMPIENRPLLWVAITYKVDDAYETMFMFRAPWDSNSPQISKETYSLRLEGTQKAEEILPVKIPEEIEQKSYAATSPEPDPTVVSPEQTLEEEKSVKKVNQTTSGQYIYALALLAFFSVIVFICIKYCLKKK